MAVESTMAQVYNEQIEFVTLASPGSPFATLERRVVVTAPPALVALAQSGDTRVLDELVPLLADPERAWAAEVLLAAMTGEEAKIVDSFAAHPSEWWATLGENAQARWREWLEVRQDKLVWDQAEQMFSVVE